MSLIENYDEVTIPAPLSEQFEAIKQHCRNNRNNNKKYQELLDQGDDYIYEVFCHGDYSIIDVIRKVDDEILRHPKR